MDTSKNTSAAFQLGFHVAYGLGQKYTLASSPTNTSYPAAPIAPEHLETARAIILAKQIELENHLTQSRQFFQPAFNWGYFWAFNNNNTIESSVAAIIDDSQLGRILVCYQQPVICALIFANPQCSLCDQVRIATYLVSVGCYLVRFDSRIESVLRYTVSVLCTLINQNTENNTANTCQYAEAASNKSKNIHPEILKQNTTEKAGK